MGVITLKIDDELERKLRVRAGVIHGASRGALSASVEDALRVWLGEEKAPGVDDRLYLARLNGAKIAEAKTLEELAEKLRSMNASPREVIIESLPPPETVTHMGLRTRS